MVRDRALLTILARHKDYLHSRAPHDTFVNTSRGDRHGTDGAPKKDPDWTGARADDYTMPLTLDIPPIVTADNLTVEYGPVKAVQGVSFTVHGGEVLGVLGGNGAGKSSTLRAIGGVNPPTGGHLSVSGLNLSDPADAEKARVLVGYTPDVGGLIRAATVREHVGLALASRDLTQHWPAAAALIEKFELSHVVDRDTAGFSHGMSRRLSVLLAALTARTVLVLDEPFDGVDPVGVEATMSVIREAKEAGLAVIVSTHLLPLLVECSDTIMVMLNGRIQQTAPAVEFQGKVGQDRYQALLAGRG